MRFVSRSAGSAIVLATIGIGFLASAVAAWSTNVLLPSAPRSRRLRISILAAHDEEGVDEDCCRRTMGEALTNMATISDAGFAAKFNKRRIQSVELKASSIPGAGLGLFAKKKIKAGTIISFYPAHIIGMDIGESVRRVSLDALGRTHEQHEEDDTSNQDYLHHILGKRPLMKADLAKDLGGQTLFVDVDMSRPELPGWSSHRINDGATVLENSEDGVLTYYRASRKAKNCVLVPFGPSPLLATVTTKKVGKGDELFTTYGCSYWLESLLTGTGEAEETSMTESIVLEAKEVAMDVLRGMQSVAVTNAGEAEELQAVFDAP